MRKLTTKIANFTKNNFVIISILFLYIVVTSMFDATCIFRYITGIACPACGATRAYLSLLRADFKMAFYYHPLFPILLPMVIYMVLGNKPLFGSKTKQNVILILFSLLVLITWILRLFFWENSEFFIDNSRLFME